MACATVRHTVAGYAVRTLDNGLVKIEGQLPMTRHAADLFLAEAAERLRSHGPVEMRQDRDDSADFAEIDRLIAAGVDI